MNEKYNQLPPELLVEVSRGKITERRHTGHVVVIGSSGDIILSKGDPHAYTYMRSCAKPVQVLPLIESGAADYYGFSNKEIAIMCASHYAEPDHLDTLRKILKKLDLRESDLQCGETTSLKLSHAFYLVKKGFENRPFFNDCSGKHLGMLAYTLFKKRSIDFYLDPEHETQQDILNAFGRFCEFPVQEITLGIDGCSAPVFALPLFHMALAFQKLSNSHLCDKRFREPADKVFHAMVSHPDMVAGTDGFCSELMKITQGKLIGKIGAEGVYCVGVRDKGLGLAVKIEDGSMAALSSVVVQFLSMLDVLTEDEKQKLEKFRVVECLNDRSRVVGYQKPAF